MGRGIGRIPVRSGLGARLWAAALVSAMAVAGAFAQRASLDVEVLEGLALQNRDEVRVVALRFCPGPQGVVFFIADPQEVEEDAARGTRPALNALYIYSPGHPQWGSPQQMRGRTEGNLFAIRNVRLQSRHEGIERELVLDGDLQMWMGRYLETDPMSLRVRMLVTGRLTLQRPPGSSRFLISQHSALSHFRSSGAVTTYDFTAAPQLEFRAVEGGRRVIANLTLGAPSGRAHYWTYFFPLQRSESQIQVDALDPQGAVMESLQLRNQRDAFAGIDGWSARFRRLQSGQPYRLRARVDLGMLGTLEEKIDVTVFDY